MKPRVGSSKKFFKLTNLQLDGLRKKREKTQITKIINDIGSSTINLTEIKSSGYTKKFMCQ